MSENLENAKISSQYSMVKITWTYEGRDYGFITSKKMLEAMGNDEFPTIMEMRVFNND